MKFELKEYQEVAAGQVLTGLRKGNAEYVADREYTAVSLSAPTGSGKTVIAAAVIERVLFGDPDGEGKPADPNAVFLWLTDDPSLNAQTRKKILEASDRIQPSQLVTLDDGFDQPKLDTGKVYFLNIQKLSRTSSLTRRAEGRRRHPIWETLTATILDPSVHYYLVIDEAHRGTGTRQGDRKTIAQKLMNGAEGQVPAAPVVWGISATPERFNAAVDSAVPARLPRRAIVPVGEVRESGLIKDVLSISHRGEQQTMEATLVRQAAKELKVMDAAWAAYTAAEDESAVRPVLVLQLAASAKPADVGGLLDVIAEEWPDLQGAAVAHSLESHTAHEFGAHTVRYVPPQDIQDHPAVRVVLFKEALTTGWDCPRAEVMVSLRTARDTTYIAQLIGRMVRTPLARRVESDETLNRVRLYLPNFDTDAVRTVKEALEDDPEGGVVDVEVDSVDAHRNSHVPADVFDVVEGLPSYVVPGPVHRSQVGRLHKLAALLVGDGLLPDAIAASDGFLVGVLEQERARLDGDGKLAGLVNDAETATMAMLEVNVRTGQEQQVTTVDVATDAADVDRLFADAKRKFRDGLAATYWGHRVTASGDDPYDAKILTAALAADTSTVEKVEKEAADRVRQWLDTYGVAISGLSEDRKARYAEVRAMARKPEVTNPGLPSAISMPGADDIPAHTRHLYADRDGNFRTTLNPWETKVLTVESGLPGFTAWYRNPTGGQRAIRVPYVKDVGYGKMYPDFVVLHSDGAGGLRASIVDPHGHHLGDAGQKLRGLAAYAETHGGSYARIVAVIKDSGGEFRMLDLKDPTVRGALAGVNDKEAIEAVFAAHGATYN